MVNGPVHITIYCDGAARGNPGPASYGYAVKDQSGQLLISGNKYLGTATNNEAEYQGIIAALTAVIKNCPDLARTLACPMDTKNWLIDVRMDSQLVVEQLNGHYKVRNDRMRVYYLQVKELEDNFQSVSYNWLPREKNKEADKLANKAIDDNF